MKKYFLAASAALLALAANAKTADELRIYINPGHGSWTGGDRPMAIMGHDDYKSIGTDTTSFFESNTNLRKGFGMLEKLREMGLKFDPTLNQEGDYYQAGAARDFTNNIVMSHVKLGPYFENNLTFNQITSKVNAILNGRDYSACTEAEKAEIDAWNAQKARVYICNRNLPEISAEVEANNFDAFVSIHSNAGSDSSWKTTNHALMIYRGYDKPVEVKGCSVEFQNTCRAMAAACWKYHFGNGHETWTSYSPTNMNLRGDINFYGSSWTGDLGYTGYLGVLQHGVPGFLSEGYFHDYAPSALRHMNWDVCYVEGYGYAHGLADYFGIAKESTGTIYGVIRDAHKKFVDPKYVAIPTSPDLYKPLNNITVELRKGDQVVDTYTTDGQFNGAFVFNGVAPGEYTMTFSGIAYKSGEPVAVTVTAGDVVYPAISLESEEYVPPTDEYSDYPDPLEGTDFEAPHEFNFKYSVSDVNFPELEGKLLKRLINRGKLLYILTHSAEGTPEVFVIDATTQAIVAHPSVDGCEGTHSPLNDIAVTADGVLVGINLELCHLNDSQVQSGETRGESKFYYWNNNEDGLPEGAPVEWFSSQMAGNWYRAVVGHNMAYSGTFEEGKAVVSCQTASGQGYSFNTFTIIDKQKASEGYRSKAVVTNAYMTEKNVGHNASMLFSPIKDDCIIMNSPQAWMQQIIMGKTNNDHAPDLALDKDGTEGILAIAAANTNFFKYNNTVYLAAPDMDADGNCMGIKLIDVTEGFDTTLPVTTAGTALDATEGNVGAAGRVVAHYDTEGNVTSADVELYLIRGSMISFFSTAVPAGYFKDYPDPMEGSEFEAPHRIDFTQDIVDQEIPELEGKTIMRLVNYNSRLYILAHDSDGTPSLYVINGRTLQIVAEPSVEGCQGTKNALKDIAVTADGVLIGVNLELCHLNDAQVEAGETRGECEVYFWENDIQGLPVGEPAVWFTSEKPGTWYRGHLGFNLAYAGTFDEGKAIISSQTTGSGAGYCFNIITIAESQNIAEEYRSKARVSAYMKEPIVGHNATIHFSPIKDNCFIVNSPIAWMQQVFIADKNDDHDLDLALDQDESEDLLRRSSHGTNFFKYNGVTYLVAPDMNAENMCTGVKLLDITEGFDAVLPVSAPNAALAPNDARTLAAAGEVLPKHNGGKLSGADIVLYLARGNKLSRFTTEEGSAVDNISIDTPAAAAVYYRLNGTRVNGHELPAGIYIKVAGGKASKVIIR